MPEATVLDPRVASGRDYGNPDPEWRRIDWRQRLSRFSAIEGFALAESADSSPYLAAADLMVTDHSSIGFEFFGNQAWSASRTMSGPGNSPGLGDS